MTLQEFAAAHHLKCEQDVKGQPIIAGALGDISELPDGRFELSYFPRVPSARLWQAVRERCQSIGMRLIEGGLTWGSLSLDPHDERQARTAVVMIQAHWHRVALRTAKS